MSVSKVGRVLAGLALIVGVSACDDNPLAENRDEAEYFRLNPSTVSVNAGSTVTVDATVLNQYGAATGDAVTATPCDNKITAVADTARSVYEYPERFVITGSNALGASCLVVRGGGVTDTITVNVVPASINVTGLDTLASGEQGTLTVQFRNSAGAPATGLTASSVRYVSLDPLIVTVADSMTGTVAGQAPGTGRVVVTTRSSTGATRVDTASIVVRAGAFTGTVATTTLGNASGPIQAVTLTQGAIPFDADTNIKLVLANGDSVRTIRTITTGTQRQAILPFGLPAGNLRIEVTNIGPNQVASIANLNLPTGTPAADSFSDNSPAVSTRTIAVGETVYGSIGNGDAAEFVQFTITEAGTYRVSMDWTDASDHDLYVRNGANTSSLLTLEGGVSANPETGTVTLQPGTYWLRALEWTHDPQGGRASTYRMTLVKT